MRVDVRGVGWDVDGRTIVDEVTATVRPGTFTGLIGPNGSGKTTLLHVVAGLLAPDRGSVRVDGDDVHAMGARDRATRVALLEQHASTTLDLTVRQVVELGRIPHRGRWPGRSDEGAEQVDRALRLSRVDGLVDRRWQTLSGGERQRVQLARALAQEPQVLLLDEPTNHLDLSHQIDFLATVRDLEVTVVAALHDLDLAAAFCDDLVVLRQGRVVASGAVADVMTSGMIREVYDVSTSVRHDHDAGRLTVTWHR
ncbi:ABC transporter ATP-binding protein [Aeromicrobium endophyticum]|uniref:ABC transporter ATP-binding protein n=1 Tax=Aeromicrobium endophyticum TaxID=2292704 RepID=A0A371P459_9ACTN|nr:ABC transporter ATP-binding protein [Aeromicrobium endophyticum]REK70196.1 ABC transporter ATP-binding protein [Aeromicrobium endophyticum]